MVYKYRMLALFCMLLMYLSTLGTAAVYHVEILVLDARQPLTPPVAVVHDSSYELYGVGAPATAGLEALAEDGVTATLVAEAESQASVFSTIVGGDEATVVRHSFFVEANPGDLLSMVSMLARTNDVFAGMSGVELPADNTVIAMELQPFDAGTELNTGWIQHIPAYGFMGEGVEEDSVVSEIDSFVIENDPDHGREEFTWPPVALLTITPKPEAIRYRITIQSESDGQPLTTPVVAVHTEDVQVFALGDIASPGIERVAEVGAAAGLIDELNDVSGVYQAFAGVDGISFEHEVTLVAEPGDLLSIVTRLARSNDVITAVRDAVLPNPDDGALVMETAAFDAGTEENTGAVQDIPFYGGNGSPDENRIITMIRSYTIVDDPDSGQLRYFWPPVATVTIEPIIEVSVGGWAVYD